MTIKLRLFSSAILFVLLCYNSPTYAKKTVQIGVLTDFLSTDFRPTFYTLSDEIKAVVGNDANVVIDDKNVLINNFDSAKARDQYLRLLNSSVDIILAFGPVNNELITRQPRHTKPTILFGAVNADLIGIDLEKNQSEIRNFTYMVAPLSYTKDLSDFHKIFPFQNLAIVGFGPWINDDSRRILADAMQDYDSAYELISYQSLDQFRSAVKGFDSVYMAEGFGISITEIEQMADVLVDLKLPSFTTTRSKDVELGWLASNQSENNIEMLFRRIALSVEAVINGEDLSKRPVYIDLSDAITINYNTAEKVGVPIRLSQLATTNLVGSFTEFVVDESYTLVEAIELALKENLNLRAANLDVKLAKQTLKEAQSAYKPDVSLTASNRWTDPDVAAISNGQNPERVTSGSVGVSQVLYSEDGSAAIGVQRRLYQAQQDNFRVDELDTVLNTTRASLNLLRAEKALQSQAENLDITKRNLKVAQQNFNAGRSSKADIFRFRSELAINLQNVISSITQFRQAQHALNAQLNRPIATRIEIMDVRHQADSYEPEEFSFERLQATLDDPAEQRIFESFLIEQANDLSPEISAIDNNIKATERNLAQYGWRRFIPTVSASAQYNRVFDRDGIGVPPDALALDDDYTIGLNFSVPLFNGGQDDINKLRIEQQLQQLELQRSSLRQSIETRVRDSVLDVSSRVANIRLSEVAEQAAEQTLDLIEASYANGAVTITELIDAQNNYLQSQLSSATAYFNFLESAISMERSVGTYIFLPNTEISSAEFVRLYEEFRLDAIQKGKR